MEFWRLAVQRDIAEISRRLRVGGRGIVGMQRRRQNPAIPVGDHKASHIVCSVHYRLCGHSS
jgi:hypothetical protein